MSAAQSETGIDKRYNTLSLIFGIPAIIFLLVGGILRHTQIKLVAVALLSVGLFYYGKARKRQRWWFWVFLPLGIVYWVLGILGVR